MLTRDQILGIDDLRTEVLSIEGWKGDVKIREATALERDEYEEAILVPQLDADNRPSLKPDFRNAKAKLIVKCMIDDAGDRIFKDSDAEALGKKSGRAVDQIFQAIRRLSGMTIESKKELEKNSGGALSASSPSS